MKGSREKIIIVMAYLYLMVIPITQAVDLNKTQKQTNHKNLSWNGIIEAHCDTRYTQNANDSYGNLTTKYFVLDFGRHTITCIFDADIYW